LDHLSPEFKISLGSTAKPHLKKKKKPWGEMNQSLYAHMNNKRKMKKKKQKPAQHIANTS
jgi:hypothetical protein